MGAVGCSTHESKQAVPTQSVTPSPAPSTPPHAFQFPEKPATEPVKEHAADAKPSGPRRGFLLQGSGGGGGGRPGVAAGGQPAVPEDPRLRTAAALKIWAPVKLEGRAITVCVKSTWAKDVLDVHIAMLGPQESLEQLTSGVNGFQIQFTNPDGKELMMFDINPHDFQWAPRTVNNGVPTLQLDASVPCPLEPYEEATNINWNWN